MKNLLAALTILVGLTAWSGQASSSIGQERTTHLLLTQALFSAVYAEYIAQGSQGFNAPFLANEKYLQIFLAEWSRRIETQKFTSSTQIFSDLSQSGGFLARHYDLWDSSQGNDFRSRHFVNLGGARNQFLGYVIYSEEKFPKLRDRILNLLDRVNILLLTNSEARDLSQLIAFPFTESKDPEIRAKALNIVGAKTWSIFLSTLPWARDLLGAASGAALLRANGLLRIPSLPWRSGFVSGWAKQLVRNPGISLMSVARGISTGVHASIAGALYLGRAERTGSVLTYNDELDISVLKLWQAVANVFPETLRESAEDFQTQFTPKSKDAITQSIETAIAQKSTDFDYLDAFIQVEKLLRFDFRNSDDYLAMDFVSYKIQKLQQQIRAKFTGKRLTFEDIDEIRHLAIDGPLKSYKREYPNLMGTFLGWGGNCVAQTMLLTGLFNPFRNQLPAGNQLGVAVFVDHIEPVIMSEDSYLFLNSGQIASSTSAKIYKPEYLLALTLRNFSVGQQDVRSMEILEGKRHKKTSSGKFSLSHFFRGIWDKLFSDSRFGILEITNAGESGEAALGDDETVPESALNVFSAAHRFSEGDLGLGGTISDLDISGFLSTLSVPLSKTQANQAPRLMVNYTGPSDAPISFTYLKILDRIEVSNRDLYSKLVLASRADQFDPTEILKAQLKEDLQRYIEGPKYTAHLANVALDINSLTALSAEEMKSWNDSFEAFKMSFVETNSELIGSNYNCEFINCKLVGWSFEFSKKLEEDYRRIYEQISKNPRKFLALYSKMDSQKRLYLMEKLFPSALLANLPRDRKFQQALDISEKIPSLRQMAWEQVRLFLRDLSKQNVQITQGFDLDKVIWLWKKEDKKSQLPTAKVAVSGEAEGGTPSNSKIKTVGRSEILQMNPNILIELAVLFDGAGMQVWTESVVDALIKWRSWGFIDNFSATKVMLRRALMFDPPPPTPYFEKLNELLRTSAG